MLIIFNFENFEMIKQYVDFEVSIKTFIKLHELTKDIFSNGMVYTASERKIAVILPDSNIEETYDLAKKFIHYTKDPIYINNLPISTIVKGGIVNYPYHETDINNIMIMLDKVLEQSDKSHNDVIIYDKNAELEKIRYYQDLVSLYHALKNNMFTMHYQPIIKR